MNPINPFKNFHFLRFGIGFAVGETTTNLPEAQYRTDAYFSSFKGCCKGSCKRSFVGSSQGLGFRVGFYMLKGAMESARVPSYRSIIVPNPMSKAL